MAIISVNLSQAVVDGTANSPPETISSPIDAIFKMSYSIETNYQNYLTSTKAGSTYRFNYWNGSYDILNGVVLSNPTASSGTATATSDVFTEPNVKRLSVGGNLNYEYSIDASGDPSFSLTVGLISTLATSSE